MRFIQRGRGQPLLLVHGLGGSWRSWAPILDGLASEREVVAVDLPGHGDTPPLAGATSVYTLADAMTSFLREHHLEGIDAVGSSLGARLVLELARRGGVLGAVVALNPGGFWRRWERHVFFGSIWASIRAVRALQPLMPAIAKSRVGRTLLLAQFSARPWRLAPSVVLDEMRTYAASPIFDELLHELAYGRPQEGAPRGSIRSPLFIGWGRRDRVCLPRQAARAVAMFPDAKLQWFERCGHFPHWDAPEATTRLILRQTVVTAAAAGGPERVQSSYHGRRPGAAVRQASLVDGGPTSG